MTDIPFSQQVTFLYTKDLATTAQFYEEIMGLPLALDQGSCRIYRVSKDGFLGFCERATSTEPTGVIFTFVTSHVDDWYRQLQERGVKFDKPPQLNPEYNIYHCFLRDPNGYLLEIQEFLAPEWQKTSVEIGD